MENGFKTAGSGKWAVSDFLREGIQLTVFSFFTGMFVLCPTVLPAQAEKKLAFFQPADSLHKGRVALLTIGGTVGYGATLVGLNHAWYQDYPRSSFHFFNDGGEWKDMDKFGHVLTSYFETEWVNAAFRWAGVKEERRIWYAAGVSILMQSTIEVLDGFSSQWGFSMVDMAANLAGPALYISQEKLWGEQRIRLKFSMHRVDHPDFLIEPENGGPAQHLDDRVKSLYGKGLAERLLKDYNGQTYWITFNPLSFFPDKEISFWPDWLSLALGSSVKNIYGGFQNRWEENGWIYSLSEDNFPRSRQYFLSLDIDLRKIPVRSRPLKTMLAMLNVLKVPGPALEVDSRGNVRGYWLYF